jgi:hypothetical protein
MNSFNPGDRLRTDPLDGLMDGLLDFRLWRLEIIEGRPEAITESPPTLAITDDKGRLPVLQAISAMVG